MEPSINHLLGIFILLSNSAGLAQVVSVEGSISLTNKQSDAINPSLGVDTAGVLRIKAASIGDTIEGGLVFWIDDSGYHGLVCSLEDLTDTVRWGNGSFSDTGARGDGIGAGVMNSMLIMLRQGIGNHQFAAQLCLNYRTEDSNIYQDWYLPAKHELDIIYSQLFLRGIGNLATDNYWSSTETNTNNATVRHFGNPLIFAQGKNQLARVRAVKRF